MKKNKATGPDGIPAEVWKGSNLASNELFFFLRHVWEQECVPKRVINKVGSYSTLINKVGSLGDLEQSDWFVNLAQYD